MDYIHIPYPVYIGPGFFLCAVAVVGHDDVARVLFSLRLAWYGYRFIIRFNISNGIELQTKHWNALHQNIHVIFGNVINKGTTKFKRSRETGSNFIISHRSPSISRHGMAWQNDCMCMCVCVKEWTKAESLVTRNFMMLVHSLGIPSIKYATDSNSIQVTKTYTKIATASCVNKIAPLI